MNDAEPEVLFLISIILPVHSSSFENNLMLSGKNIVIIRKIFQPAFVKILNA